MLWHGKLIALPKKGDKLTLLDKSDWHNFTEGKSYTILSDCVEEKWKTDAYCYTPAIKAHILDDNGAEKRINLHRFKLDE